MSIADDGARMAFDAALDVRGVEVEYVPKGRAEGARLRMVPGSTDAEEFGDIDADQTARTSDWLCFRAVFFREVGRLPIEGDRLRRLDTGEVYRVAPMGEPRAWRKSGNHGGVIRLFSLEVHEDA